MENHSNWGRQVEVHVEYMYNVCFYVWCFACNQGEGRQLKASTIVEIYTQPNDKPVVPITYWLK